MIRSVPNIMEHYGCSSETAQRYIDLRDEGYQQHQALLMAGLSDPPEPAQETAQAGLGVPGQRVASDAKRTPGPTLTPLEQQLLDALVRIEATYQASDGRIGTGRYSFPANGMTADILRGAIASATVSGVTV